jgi:hypothetical protein
VGKIPAETARQTDTLTMINHQLEAAADADVQLAGSFVKFKDTLDRLNHSTAKNTDGLVQMSKTFAASDRYLKYVVTKLNKRYAWVWPSLRLSARRVCAGRNHPLPGAPDDVPIDRRASKPLLLACTNALITTATTLR